MPGFTNVREVKLETPFGEPSDPLVLGELSGRKVAFRRGMDAGTGFALGAELQSEYSCLQATWSHEDSSVSAVGSLKEEHKPTDFVIADQFIDRTFNRVATFFGEGIVGHVAFGDPVCATVAKAAETACKE